MVRDFCGLFYPDPDTSNKLIYDTRKQQFLSIAHVKNVCQDWWHRHTNQSGVQDDM